MYVDGHTVKDCKNLPLNMLDAVRALDGSSVLRAALGDAFVGSYVK